MTRTYILTQLLRLGPLTLREIVTITGWSSSCAGGALRNTLDSNAVQELRHRSGVRYVATAGRLDGPGDERSLGPVAQGRAPTPRACGSSRQGANAGNSHRPLALLRECPKGVK
ncbi:MAG: hypothetical protein JZU58_24475 [Curvibacter lanceolatus]|uniref:hypothetical protein n=1 Tax=Curvibacter lanceolatus TaxID=86182 RepID=UPI0023546C6A|nr:hypothetical protein [Curvibacter lanceolatus]MBV5295504.1 hypothetical protein [Curvibacter lanceolatus]